MKLQQLIVDASSVEDNRKNLLVATSNNVKPELAEQAIMWSTQGNEIFGDESSAVFYCRSRAGTGMIGRSYACSFDSHGNRQMRTHWVFASSNQMKCYFNNAVLFIRTLNSSGQWMLQTSSLARELPELEVGDCPINSFAYPDQQKEVELSIRTIKDYKRVAIPNACRPLSFIGQVLSAYSFKERAKVSFALDRRVTGDSLFELNTFSSDDERLKQDFSEHDVFALRLRSAAVHS